MGVWRRGMRRLRASATQVLCGIGLVLGSLGVLAPSAAVDGVCFGAAVTMTAALVVGMAHPWIGMALLLGVPLAALLAGVAIAAVADLDRMRLRYDRAGLVLDGADLATVAALEDLAGAVAWMPRRHRRRLLADARRIHDEAVALAVEALEASVAHLDDDGRRLLAGPALGWPTTDDKVTMEALRAEVDALADEIAGLAAAARLEEAATTSSDDARRAAARMTLAARLEARAEVRSLDRPGDTAASAAAESATARAAAREVVDRIDPPELLV